ncbi:unnamed protein product [Prorocentrum cordatum]|uniref:Uncharacterized protein n=1 Tax=Prorocentrum cordatum TaxID=2364126 RepID=A0ABN9S366_9DINO|nr:unnamed protein product [Polarella glacialis]
MTTFGQETHRQHALEYRTAERRHDMVKYEPTGKEEKRRRRQGREDAECLIVPLPFVGEGHGARAGGVPARGFANEAAKKVRGVCDGRPVTNCSLDAESRIYSDRPATVKAVFVVGLRFVCRASRCDAQPDEVLELAVRLRPGEPQPASAQCVQCTAAGVVLDGVGATGAAEAARGPCAESAGRRPTVQSSPNGRREHAGGDQRGEPAHVFAERLHAMPRQRAHLPVIEPAPEVDLGVNFQRRP